LTNFFDDITVSVVVFFITGGVVLVRLFIDDGIEVFVLLLLTVVIERDRNFDDEFCATDDFDIVGGRIVFFVVVLLTDVTARLDVTVESFFVFVATGVGTFDFFTGVNCFVNEVVVRIGNFEAFFADRERILLLLLLLLFDGRDFEFEVLFEFVLRLVEQREGRREGRTTAGGVVVAAIVRVVGQRWTFEFKLRSLAVIAFTSSEGEEEETNDSSCGIFAITNVSER